MTLCLVCLDRPPVGRSRTCGGCFARIRGDLATVAYAHWWLGRNMLALRPALKEGTIGRASEPQPPFALELHDERFAIEENLHGWAAFIAENPKWAQYVTRRWRPPLVWPPATGPADSELATVIRWLLEQCLPWVSDQMWVAEFADHMFRLRSNAYAASPWERARNDLAAPCPGCTLLTLSWYPGDTKAVCRNRACGTQLQLAEMKETRRWTRSNQPGRPAAA